MPYSSDIVVTDFFGSRPQETSQKKEILNILNSREVLPDYGDLSKAMAKLGYNILIHDSSYESKESIDLYNKNDKVEQLKALHNCLQQGRTKNVPLYLASHVEYFKQTLIEEDIHGIFVPPTLTGALFSSMVEEIDSGFESVAPADRGEMKRVEKKYNSLLKEVSIILAARTLDIPVLGSCHGAQLLWYMHGGSLYALPQYSTHKIEQFHIVNGRIQNPNHSPLPKYNTTLDTEYHEEAGYASDEDEEEKKDYDHNLLMIVPDAKWLCYHAKPHPLMHIQNFFLFAPGFCSLYQEPTLPKGMRVAKSFDYPGCIALQWHPHRDIDSKSAIHYLHEFGRQCLKCKEVQAIRLHRL